MDKHQKDQNQAKIMKQHLIVIKNQINSTSQYTYEIGRDKEQQYKAEKQPNLFNVIKNFNQSKKLYIAKVSVIVMFILILIVLITKYIPKMIQDKYMKILISNGSKIELPYLNSQLIIPKYLKQKSVSKLSIQNTTIIRLFLADYPQKFNFSKILFMNWKQNNSIVDQAQYYLLNSTYNLDKDIPEKRICVMAPFHNLLKYGYDGSFHNFLKSIDAQNYSNYMVYMIDDVSTDDSVQAILTQLKNYPRLNNRLRIIKNAEKIGALGNRDSTTRNYCQAGDIVMDIDGDDAIIGKQVFNLYNHIYHNNPQAWFVYTNFISVQGSANGDGRGMSHDMDFAKKGPCRQLPLWLHISNTYRTNIANWVTSQLRSYLWELYIKIPLEYVLERQTGRYYYQASDRFSMYAISQLAGPNHTFFYEQYTYFYYAPNYRALQKLGCDGGLQILFYCQAQSRMLTPLKPLKNLMQNAKITQMYVLPAKIIQYYITKQQNWLLCQQVNKGISQVFK